MVLRAAVVLYAKDPSPERDKTRLASSLSPAQLDEIRRERLAR
jgi:hypothetical protein